MDIDRILFFELLRAGLWDRKPQVDLFEGSVPWEQIYRLGVEQGVLGLLLDAIALLPQDIRPPRPLYIQWCATVVKMEDDNRKLNNVVAELFTMLRANGVEPVLLKGQGAALSYPDPLHRQSGDIDIYIGRKNFQKVNRLLDPDGHVVAERTANHSGYQWHGETVENHQVLGRMFSPRANRRFRRIISSWHDNNRFDLKLINGVEISLPPVDFNIVFLLQHAVKHLIGLGIGLRQICDWTLLLHKESDRIDREAVAGMLKAIGLDKAAGVFSALAVEYLGLPHRDVPVSYSDKDIELSRWLVNDIIEGGNFGFASTRWKNRPKSYWSRKWTTFKTMLERRRKLKAIVPAEERWLPIKTVNHMFLAQCYKIMGKSQPDHHH